MAEPSSPKRALDKLAFLMAFVPYLAQRGRVSVAEAAQHFGFEEDFIRRSAWALSTTGVASDGLPDGDLFDLDFDALEQDDEIALVYRIAIDDEVPRLSGREAAALLAGLQLVAADPAVAQSPDFATLMGKLRQGAASAPEPIAVDVSDGPHTAALRRAIAERHRVEFTYRGAAAEAAMRREVEPLRIEAIDAVHHLRAWCLLRGAVRTFRLDRISELTILTTPATHDVTVIDDAASPFVGGEGEPLVSVEFDAAATQLAADYRPVTIEVDRRAARARMTVAIAAPSTLQRLVTELPGAVVVAPAQVRRALHEWARDALARYADAPE